MPDVTDLQRYVLQYLCENDRLDSDDGRKAAGATARDIADRSNDWYAPAAITRCLNGLARATTGNADHAPRPPYVREVKGLPALPLTGKYRQWVATPDGANAIGWDP